MPRVKRTKVPANREQILRHMAGFPQLADIAADADNLSPKQIMDRIRSRSHLIHQRIAESIEQEAEETRRPNPEYRRSNIFDARDLEAIVNPVNCAGAMGKGLALRFAKRYPEILEPYRNACRNATLTVKRPQVITLHRDDHPKHVVNLATKQHWRDPSQLEWINSGLDSMYRQLLRLDVTSVGIPALGAGLGGLRWPDVQQIIEKHANWYRSRIRTVVYEPAQPARNRNGQKSKGR